VSAQLLQMSFDWTANPPGICVISTMKLAGDHRVGGINLCRITLGAVAELLDPKKLRVEN